jgi:RNA polymerase sigma factor (sigma-70 family)
MLTWACIRTCGADLAEDALQDLMEAFPGKIQSFDPARGPLRSWLSVVARNQARRTAGRFHRHQAISLDAGYEEGTPRLRAEACTERDAVEALVEARDLLAKIVPVLTDRELLVITRVLIDDQPASDLAAEQGWQAVTVRTTLNKARNKIRRHLAGLNQSATGS